MTEINFDELAEIIAATRRIELAPTPEVNFFDIGGSGYLEKPTSDLLALFMGMNSPYVPPWLAKALLTCLKRQNIADKDFEMDWENVTAEREVPIVGANGGTKFLDILISDGTNVIGIENKVYADSSYNPFSDYSRLIEERLGGGTALRCILQAYERGNNVNREWPIVTYGELVETALDRYGRDALGQVQSKWQTFYQEFLSHLKKLSRGKMSDTMDQDATKFVLENFDMLKKAASLLQRFESDLINETSQAITEALSSHLDSDITIKTGYGNWSGEQKALRFFPSIWGEQSQVVIYYFVDTDDSEDGTIGFGVCVYISAKTTHRSLKEIEETFNTAIENETLPISITPWEKNVYYEQNGRILCLDAYPTSYTRTGAIEAAKDFTVWLQKNAFDKHKS